MDELGLEVVCYLIPQEYKIEIDVGEPKVIYVETIRKTSTAEGKYIRQTGGSGNYGHVKILLEPSERGKGFEFIDAVKDGVVPKQFINATPRRIARLRLSPTSSRAVEESQARSIGVVQGWSAPLFRWLKCWSIGSTYARTLESQLGAPPDLSTTQRSLLPESPAATKPALPPTYPKAQSQSIVLPLPTSTPSESGRRQPLGPSLSDKIPRKWFCKQLHDPREWSRESIA